MSKLISVKLDEKILAETDEMVEKLGISPINLSMKPWLNTPRLKKEPNWKRKSEMRHLLVRESSMEVLKEFEALEDDYDSI